MRTTRTSVTLLAAALLAASLAGCGGSGATPQAETSATASEASASPSASATAEATPLIVVTRDVPFESSSLNKLGKLDVYAPWVVRDWPVVVMYHGDPMSIDKGYLSAYATRVAALGFVVFVPSWGHSGGAEYDQLSPKEALMADDAQAACALAFAAEHAGDYGGDPWPLTVFGHSAGGNVGSAVILDRPELRDGCLAQNLPEVNVFVPWEADWLLIYPFWDPMLAADPTLLEAMTPWAHLPAPPNLRWTFIRSENPGVGRDGSDARGPDGWVALRDPDGTFEAALAGSGAFEDDYIGPADLDTILVEALEAQGSEVSVRILPGSSHEHLSDEGWRVFLDTFREIGGYE